jgi:pentatricopeptide repeat protein
MGKPFLKDDTNFSNPMFLSSFLSACARSRDSDAAEAIIEKIIDGSISPTIFVWETAIEILADSRV